MRAVTAMNCGEQATREAECNEANGAGKPVDGQHRRFAFTKRRSAKLPVRLKSTTFKLEQTEQKTGKLPSRMK